LVIKRITKVVSPYFLQIDVKSFFCNINKNILFAILKNKLKKPKSFKKDKEKIMWLAKTIIFHDPTKNYYLKGKKNYSISFRPTRLCSKRPRIRACPLAT